MRSYTTDTRIEQQYLRSASGIARGTHLAYEPNYTQGLRKF